MADHVHNCMQDMSNKLHKLQARLLGRLKAGCRQTIGQLKARLRGMSKASYRQAVDKLQANCMQPMGHLSLTTGCFKGRTIACKCVW